jgi:hypothetical protein
MSFLSFVRGASIARLADAWSNRGATGGQPAEEAGTISQIAVIV